MAAGRIEWQFLHQTSIGFGHAVELFSKTRANQIFCHPPKKTRTGQRTPYANQNSCCKHRDSTEWEPFTHNTFPDSAIMSSAKIRLFLYRLQDTFQESRPTQNTLRENAPPLMKLHPQTHVMLSDDFSQTVQRIRFKFPACEFRPRAARRIRQWRFYMFIASVARNCAHSSIHSISWLSLAPVNLE